MRPLSDPERRRLLTWSAIVCAIPLCLAPLAGRSSFELASEQAAFDARFAVPSLKAVWNEKPLTVARDPFLSEEPPGAYTTPAANGVVGMHVTAGAPTGFVLPGNHEAAAVTAIVTGASPRALIDDGEHVRVIRAGDMLAGSRVVRIDRSGVHLKNGTVVPLREESP